MFLTVCEYSSHGLVGHRKSDNRQEFTNPLVVVYFEIDYVKNPKGTNYWRNRVLKVIFELFEKFHFDLNDFYFQVAKEFAGKATFAVSSKDEFTHELTEYGLEYVKGDKPVAVARDAKNKKFVMKDDFS